MHIGRADILWNYTATFLKIASSVLLLPFILRMMPVETVGIWTVFMTITSFMGLLDFGFNPSFTRNVTYVFSGVRSLKAKGYSIVDVDDNSIDYGLLKGVIITMKWFYKRMAFVLFVILITLGTYYIYTLLQSYNEEHSEVYIAWFLLCVINTYSLLTSYYDPLLQGKGLIKRSKQITIIGQTGYLIIASVLIMSGFGLVAIISAQASSVVIVRLLSYRSFFNEEIKSALESTTPRANKEILHAIYPNAIKLGLTSIGGLMVSQSAIIIGSLYLTLPEIASYGITMQFIGVIASLARIYLATYEPKITQLRIEHNNTAIKKLFLKGQIFFSSTYLLGGVCLVGLGKWILELIGSQTQLMPQLIILVAIVVIFLETNHAIAGAILVTKNEVPFFKASLLSGGSTVLLLLIFFNFTNLRLLAMIAAQGIAQGAYQNWKWPLEVTKELKITAKDIRTAMYETMMTTYQLLKLPITYHKQAIKCFRSLPSNK